MLSVCPATVVKQTEHPFLGPALVSPDINAASSKDPQPPLKTVRSLPTSATRAKEQAQASPSGTFLANDGSVSPGIKLLAPRSELQPKGGKPGLPPSLPNIPSSSSGGTRLNKFVRRLHDMLQAEKASGIVEWRRGLLVLHSTDAFAKTILPKYFNTRNFKTFRRQLNYYGFVHVRSFSTTGSTTTALWVNRDLAKRGSAEISSVLMLKRVEPCESAKTAEGRRVRKELAIFTVEEDIGVSPKTLQMEQIRSLAMRAGGVEDIICDASLLPRPLATNHPPVPTEVHCFHPSAPAAPAPLFPKLSSATPVAPTEEKKQAAVVEAVASPAEEKKEESPEGDVGAANLLLMLAKGPSAAATARLEELRSAIAPGQFLM